MRRSNSRYIGGVSVVLALASLALAGADWPRFRGAGGTATSDETGLPARWSDSEGLRWKTALPGAGSSSAIISGNRLFLTCYSGYGLDRRNPGDQEKLRRHVVCVDAESGKVLWDRSIESKLPDQPYSGIGMPNHGYASSTPAADGERVYAFFGRSGVIAYDYDGKEVWRAEVASDPRTHVFGTASSPVVWKDLVIVPASVECEAIIAYDRKTGREVWRSPAAGYGGWYGTPIAVDTGERTELIVNVPGEVWGLNPANGKLRWYAVSSPDRTLCTSAVAARGVVYAIGRESGAVAVKIGGRGDVSGSHILWKGRAGSYVPSPVAYGDHIYIVSDRGIAFCLKADSGETVYEQRIEGAGGVYASAVAADGKLYVVSRRDGTFVLEAKPEFRQLAHNKFSGDDSDFNASPAISNGRLYLRSDRFLYCIANK